MASSTITLSFKNNKRGNLAESSSQTKLEYRFHHKTLQILKGRFPKKYLWEIFRSNQIYSTGFSSCGRPISISTHGNTHTIVSSNDTHYQQRASQSYYLYFGVYRSQYIVPTTTLQEFTRLNSQSVFRFFLRGVRIETTQPLRTAVALLHGIHVWIVRSRKKDFYFF